MMTLTYNKYKECDYIADYIHAIENKEILASKEIHLAIEKVKRDLEKPGIIIDNEKIEDAINYMEKYFYKLFDWEKLVVALAVGCFEGRRLLYNEFFIQIGRGNGKNGLISALANYLQTSKHGIKNYGIDIVASSEEQAKTSFEDVYNMLKEPKNAKMTKKFYSRVTKEIITFKSTNAYLRFNTSNAKTKDGKRTAAIVFDEIHSFRDYSNIKVFTSGLGKIPFSRIFYITTDGDVRGGVLDDFKEEARMILHGEIENSRMLPLIYKLDSEEEIWENGKPKLENFHLVEKANPSLKYLDILRDEIEDNLIKSQTRPQLLMETMTKRFNLPFEDTRTLVANWDEIKLTATECVDDSFEGMTCIGGLDYSSTRDFTACILLFKKGNKYYTLHHTFICKKSLELTQYKFDIDLAVKKGIATIVDDTHINPDIITNWFLEKAAKYNILYVCCDTYRKKYINQSFVENGIPLKEVRSGSYTHTRLAPIVEAIFADGLIKYGDDPMMRWYTNNVYVKKDAKENISYEKIEPVKRKTDGFMAFIHALGEAEELPSENILDDIECYVY